MYLCIFMHPHVAYLGQITTWTAGIRILQGLIEPLVIGWLNIGHYYITERKDDLNSADENAGFAVQIVAAVFDTFDSQRMSSGAVKTIIDSMKKLLNLLLPKPEESIDSEWPLLQHTVRGLMYQTSLDVSAFFQRFVDFNRWSIRKIPWPFLI